VQRLHCQHENPAGQCFCDEEASWTFDDVLEQVLVLLKYLDIYFATPAEQAFLPAPAPFGVCFVEELLTGYLKHQGWVSYRAIKVRFDLNDDHREAVKDELIYA
jgi:hypothetical protein